MKYIARPLTLLTALFSLHACAVTGTLEGAMDGKQVQATFDGKGRPSISITLPASK